MAGWQLARLGDVCSFEKEQGIHAGLPYVGLENIESGTGRFLGATNAVTVKSTTFRFSPAHVLYGRLRPYLNKVLLPAFEGHCSTEIFPMRPGAAISREYLFYWLSMDATVKSINATATGARMPRANMNAVLEFELPIPPLPEQRRIVAILDEAFEGIATAKANAEKNLQSARELFENFMHSLFSGRGPDWTERTLEEVCEISSKLVDPREPAYLDLPHIGAGNIESKSGAVIDVRTAREEQLISGKFLFDQSTVLYSKIRPYLMKVVRPTFGGLCSADIYPLVPKHGAIDRNYLFYLLLTPAFTEYAVKGSARAGMPKVNRDHLFAYRAWMPPIQEQAGFASRLDALADETKQLSEIIDAKLAALSDLKKSLLHEAFAGAL